ncbi:hypothetical protein K3495_g8913 [Podosphaera aphanis]|nr:hypothetical protein K3495_g8913 [Podosphaera aphanis]
MYLKSCETSTTSKEPAGANIVQGNRIGRGKGKGGRWKNGRNNSRQNNRNDERRGNMLKKGQWRGKSGRLHGTKFDENQCKWQALDEDVGKESSTSAGYTARVSSHYDNNEDNICSYFPVALPCVTTRSYSASSRTLTIIDSGATEHFSGVRSDFNQMKRWNSPRAVTVANGKEVICEGYGTVIIKTHLQTLELSNVWFVPEFGNVRLISVWRLNDSDIEARFSKHNCHLWKNDKKIMSVSGCNGLYEIQEAPNSTALSGTTIPTSTDSDSPLMQESSLKLQKLTNDVSSSLDISTQHRNRRTIPNDASIWNLYHRRLGHINFRDIKKLIDSGVITKSKSDKRLSYHGEKQCESCLAGRMKERFNKKTDTREHIRGRRLHADISGIQGVPVKGFKYFLVVVDDASRMYWASLLQTKEMKEVMNTLKQIIATVELQCGNKVWYVRADNGKSEFGSAITDFLKERGTQFEPCPPYKHSMNGVAERAIGILSTYARSMLFEAQLPHQLWDYAIEHAVWIRNRVPTSALPFGPNDSVTSKWNIPHAVWYEKLPKLQNLRPFGCVATLAYPKALVPQKWSPNTREGTSIFVEMRGESIHKLLFIATLQG